MIITITTMDVDKKERESLRRCGWQSRDKISEDREGMGERGCVARVK